MKNKIMNENCFTCSFQEVYHKYYKMFTYINIYINIFISTEKKPKHLLKQWHRVIPMTMTFNYWMQSGTGAASQGIQYY